MNKSVGENLAKNQEQLLHALHDRKKAVAYLAAAIEAKDPNIFFLALRDVAVAQGVIPHGAVIGQELIDEVKKRLVAIYNPVAIYLFGSYAWGCPTKDSDLDVLIVVDETDEKLSTLAALGHRALRDLEISKDLLVYKKSQFEESSGNRGTLCYKIKKEGVVLYVRPNMKFPTNKTPSEPWL